MWQRRIDLTEHEKSTAREMAGRGHTIREIAAALGWSHTRRLGPKLKEAGIHTRFAVRDGEKRPTWSEEMLNQLRADSLENLSASQLAEKYGVTRNAIIGAWHRYNIPHCTLRRERDSGIERRVVNRRRRERFKVVQLDLVIYETLNVPFLELDDRHCRWVCDGKGDDGLALFCGHQKTDHSSYCPYHTNLTINHEFFARRAA